MLINWNVNNIHIIILYFYLIDAQFCWCSRILVCYNLDSVKTVMVVWLNHVFSFIILYLKLNDTFCLK